MFSDVLGLKFYVFTKVFPYIFDQARKWSNKLLIIIRAISVGGATVVAIGDPMSIIALLPKSGKYPISICLREWNLILRSEFGDLHFPWNLDIALCSRKFAKSRFNFPERERRCDFRRRMLYCTDGIRTLECALLGMDRTLRYTYFSPHVFQSHYSYLAPSEIIVVACGRNLPTRRSARKKRAIALLEGAHNEAPLFWGPEWLMGWPFWPPKSRYTWAPARPLSTDGIRGALFKHE